MLKRISNVVLVCAVVLFSYAIAAAQNTTTTTSTNPRVVVTDNLAKTATPTNAQPTAGATKTTTVGKYSISIKEGVTGQNLENGKYVTVTKWDGSKWVSKREWVPNPPAASNPNPQ